MSLQSMVTIFLKENLRAVEAQILTKRVEMSKFETEYREVLAQFTEMTSRYTQEMQVIDDLLKQRNEIHASYTTGPPVKWSRNRIREVEKHEGKLNLSPNLIFFRLHSD
ncbi:Chaperone protein dnaJ 16, partial [Cucurbita argyrosperma subsp. sororia]